jgi:hypothetical protein
MTHAQSQTESVAFAVPAVAVGRGDVLCSLVTFALSTAVLGYAMSPIAKIGTVLALHAAILLIPAAACIMRYRQQRELTVAMLLLMMTAAAGPVGALGCAFLALALWRRQPAPERLRHWYEYISGIVARWAIVHLYEELQSGRLPSDTNTAVPRFRPILRSAPVEEQQRVLGVLGRRYHAQFRAVLREALRHRNGFIRAQAAAVATRLDMNEKMRLWSASAPPAEGSEPAPKNVVSRS